MRSYRFGDLLYAICNAFGTARAGAIRIICHADGVSTGQEASLKCVSDGGNSCSLELEFENVRFIDNELFYIIDAGEHVLTFAMMCDYVSRPDEKQIARILVPADAYRLQHIIEDVRVVVSTEVGNVYINNNDELRITIDDPAVIREIIERIHTKSEEFVALINEFRQSPDDERFSGLDHSLAIETDEGTNHCMRQARWNAPVKNHNGGVTFAVNSDPAPHILSTLDVLSLTRAYLDAVDENGNEK